MTEIDDIREKLAAKGLKATTPRLVIYEEVSKMFTHPTADEVYQKVKAKYPSISLSTVYTTLDMLAKTEIIDTLMTDGITIRYDATRNQHHHIYSTSGEEIADYYDSELDEILKNYFEKKQIKDFDIQQVKLQIIGKFNKEK